MVVGSDGQYSFWLPRNLETSFVSWRGPTLLGAEGVGCPLCSTIERLVHCYMTHVYPLGFPSTKLECLAGSTVSSRLVLERTAELSGAWLPGRPLPGRTSAGAPFAPAMLGCHIFCQFREVSSTWEVIPVLFKPARVCSYDLHP